MSCSVHGGLCDCEPAPVIPVGSEAAIRAGREAAAQVARALAWPGDPIPDWGLAEIADAVLEAATAAQGTGHERVIPATDYEWRVCISHVPSKPASWSSGPITSREAAEEALQRALALHPDDYGWIERRVAPGAWLDEYTAKTPS